MFVMTARKTLFVILGILIILAGITCFFTPVETSSVIPFIFGLAMVIDGIGRIIAWFSILDDDRRQNAQLFEDAFYGGKGIEKKPEEESKPLEGQAADLASLTKLLSNPDTADLLKQLMAAIGKPNGQ